ncbi:hypothetical protein OPT61_g2696 [Boeremia exigua]|uniref:Uncharacterized protein n=1 Tax=Boeremia exigua TaxID=749465 RepID=A0ACC2IKM4_9PLEO|nr:hypothetical protein OPT61_g2696 [Boeremia exigua]
MADSPYVLRQAHLSDLNSIARVWHKAFFDDEIIGEIMHPQRQQYPEGVYWFLLKGIRERFWDWRHQFMVVATLDEDNIETIVGAADWRRLGKGGDQRQLSQLDPRNLIAPAVVAYQSLVERLFPNRAADKSQSSFLDDAVATSEQQWTGDRTECWDLYVCGVDPDHQGKGVGKRLAQWGVQEAQKEGTGTCASVMCGEKNRGFYGKAGFTTQVNERKGEGGGITLFTNLEAEHTSDCLAVRTGLAMTGWHLTPEVTRLTAPMPGKPQKASCCQLHSSKSPPQSLFQDPPLSNKLDIDIMRIFTLAFLYLAPLFQKRLFVISTAVPASVDVAVVGGGLAGLTAAKHLLQGGKSIVVFEARDRVGGKVYNQPLANGGITEVGAEFVGPTQDKVLDMISDLGLETFATYDEGLSVVWRNSTRQIFSPDPELGGAPPVDELALMQIAIAQAQLDAWAAEVNTSAPWTHPLATQWDSHSFDKFLEDYASHLDARFVLTTACKAIFSVEPKELSLLYVIAYIAAAGNELNVGTLNRLISVKGGAQELRVVGGTGLIPERLAETVGFQHIILKAPVTHISKRNNGYRVTSQAGTVVAKSVVLAMSPPLLERITFEPPLPPNRQQLNRKTKMGALGKGIAVYDTPFWRDQENLSAQVTSDTGSVRVTFDSSPDDAAFGAILGFILGDEMRAIDKLTVEEGQQRILSDYIRYFGKTASNITEFILFRWDLEEWSGGGPTAVAPPNVLTKFGGSLRQSVNGLHFAGTETSEYWTGYMDGAIRSGERVAREIQGLL